MSVTARRVVWSLLYLGLFARAAGAQSAVVRDVRRADSRASAREQALGTLDGWLVTRFRGAQLLADTLGASVPVSSTTTYPRVESARMAEGGDTVFALHFGARAGIAALRAPSLVRLSGPTGAIATRSARVIARRAFRAPRLPGASADSDQAWRYGWGYLAILPRMSRPSGTTGYRGWLLLELPDSALATPPVPPARR